jgi:hypothetical protein
MAERTKALGLDGGGETVMSLGLGVLISSVNKSTINCTLLSIHYHFSSIRYSLLSALVEKFNYLVPLYRLILHPNQFHGNHQRNISPFYTPRRSG